MGSKKVVLEFTMDDDYEIHAFLARISSVFPAQCIKQLHLPKGELISVDASCTGDRSVGIPPTFATIMIEKKYVPTPETEPKTWQVNRKWLRESFAEIFTNLFDEQATVIFGDECENCHKLKAACKCANDEL